MSKNIKDQISINNVKKFINHYLNYLQKEGLTPFQKKPTVEIFPKRRDLIGIALIADNNPDFKVNFVNNPRQGNDYLFVSIDELKEEHMLIELGEVYAIRKISHMRVDNAYNINIQRVKKLLKDGHYAVALVFLVSAFENITKELFFLYNDIWFSQEDEDDFSDEIYRKVGIIFGPKIDESIISEYFSTYKEIDGKKIGIEKSKLDMAKNWKRTRYWERIHKICKNLGIYNEYILKKQGNNGMEIERFEILKEILKKLTKEMRTLNFQRIYGKGGIERLFKSFLNINFDGFDETLKSLHNYIKMRHSIIHGTLKDEEINKNIVLDFKSRVLKIVSYLRDELNIKYRDNLHLWYG